MDSSRAGSEHCVYYADEWFHDNKTKGAVAVAKQNVCTGQVQYWARPASFPSEAIFVGSPAEGREEDDGVLIFVGEVASPVAGRGV